MLKVFPTACGGRRRVSCSASPLRAQNTAGDPPPNPSPQSTAESKADQPADASSQATDQPPPAVRKVRNFIENSPDRSAVERRRLLPTYWWTVAGQRPRRRCGYRQHFDWAYIDVSGALSTKAYRGIDVRARWIDTTARRARQLLTFRNNTQDDFYGAGNDTTDATRVDFGIRHRRISERVSAARVRVAAARRGCRLFHSCGSPWTRRSACDRSKRSSPTRPRLALHGSQISCITVSSRRSIHAMRARLSTPRRLLPRDLLDMERPDV